MRKLDYEFIFTCGIVAFIAALGMVAGIVVLAGAKIYVYNLPLIEIGRASCRERV